MSDQHEKSRNGFLTWAVLRDILVVLLIAIIAWKLINSDLKIDLSTFSFTDLLALILALFSVSLSVAFYFKATDTSNQFYDNTYHFTKEMSEILGRIEAGFGERLRNLDEGYHGLREKFDRMPIYDGVTVAEVKKEEGEIKKKEQEQKALIEELAQKAQLDRHEKLDLFKKLQQQQEELVQARMELQNLKGISSSPENRGERRAMTNYITSKIVEAASTDPALLSTSDIRKIFESIKTKLPREALRDLAHHDFINEAGTLTRDGLIRIRMKLNQTNSNVIN